MKTILALALLAAAGDPIYPSLTLEGHTLTAPQRNCVRTWIGDRFTDALPAAFTALDCTTEARARGTQLRCRTQDERTSDAAAFLSAEADGRLNRGSYTISADGSSVTYRRRARRVWVRPAQARALVSCFGALDADAALHQFRLTKTGGTMVADEVWQVDTTSPQVHLQRRRAGNSLAPIGFE